MSKEGLRRPLAVIAVSAGLLVGGRVASHSSSVPETFRGFDPIAALPERMLPSYPVKIKANRDRNIR